MSKSAFISSAVLHGVVLTLIAMEFSFARFNAPPPPAILMVDLTKVKISDKTNLPKKAEVKKTQKKAEAKPVPPKPKNPPKVQSTKAQEKKPEPPKPQPTPQPPAKDSVKVVEPPKPKKEEKKPEKKETPKTTPPAPPKKEAPKPADRLKSLLTSVEKVRKTATVSPTPAPIASEQQLTEGIEGGTDGSLSQILTISERDLIATQLSKCWNIDPGKKDIDDAIVEIRVIVNKDGTVRDVKIVNGRSNAVFQSVADSARRAVWICDKDPEKSPFKMLAEKYADHYGDWKTILLRFNPQTGGVI